MGHKSFIIALVLGLGSLPIACSGDDDDTPAPGGASGAAGDDGSPGTGGSSTAGKTGTGGKGGSISTGGTSTAGTSAGGSGDGGLGNAGSPVGGESSGGAGGESAGAGGQAMGGASEGGSSGDGGASGDPAAERLARCSAICTMDVFPLTGSTDPPAAPCEGDPNECVVGLCDPTFNADCNAKLDTFLTCLEGAPPDNFYCSDSDPVAGGLEGIVTYDIVGQDECLSDFNAWYACHNP